MASSTRCVRTAAVGGANDEAAARGLEVHHTCSFVDPNAGAQRRGEESDAQLPGIQHAAGVLDPEAAAVQR